MPEDKVYYCIDSQNRRKIISAPSKKIAEERSGISSSVFALCLAPEICAFAEPFLQVETASYSGIFERAIEPDGYKILSTDYLLKAHKTEGS